MPGVTSELLLNKMTKENKHVLSKEDLLVWMQQQKPGLVVMAGAGDIDALVTPVKQILEG
jgi:UDP-N-acetylmuramate--alanine ligase